MNTSLFLNDYKIKAVHVMSNVRIFKVYKH